MKKEVGVLLIVSIVILSSVFLVSANIFTDFFSKLDGKRIMMSPPAPCYWPPESGGEKMAESGELMNWMGTGIENRILCHYGIWQVSYSRDGSDISAHKQSATNPKGYVVRNEGAKVGNWTIKDGVWVKIISASGENSYCVYGMPDDLEIDKCVNSGYSEVAYCQGSRAGKVDPCVTNVADKNNLYLCYSMTGPDPQFCSNGCSKGVCVKSSPTETCTDSDGGNVWSVKGEAHNSSSGNVWDSCFSATSINETTCDGKNVKSQIFSCDSGKICKDGACVKQNQTQTNATCIDSDGGLNYYVKGEVSGNIGSGYPNEIQTYSDYCLSEVPSNYGTKNTLIERYCGASYTNFTKDYECPTGCQDGACILEKNETTCTPRYVCEISPTICPKSGVQIKKCEDLECNSKNYEEKVICNPGECTGCELEGACIPYGFRKQVEVYNNNPGTYNLYCDIDGELREQKSKDPSTLEWAKCQNNYECESNVCSNAQCYEILDMIGEASKIKTFFVRLMCRVANPMSSDEYNKCLINFLGE